MRAAVVRRHRRRRGIPPRPAPSRARGRPRRRRHAAARQRRRRPSATARSAKRRWPSSKNGQVEGFGERHLSCPRTPASASRRRRGRRARNPRSPCTAPAPPPRPRSRCSTDIAHSISSMRLVMALAKVGPAASSSASAVRLGQHALRRDSRLKKPQRSASSPPMHAAGIEQLGGAALADDARQDRAGAHVAAGKPDAVEQERDLGAWRCRSAGRTPWRGSRRRRRRRRRSPRRSAAGRRASPSPPRRSCG